MCGRHRNGAPIMRYSSGKHRQLTGDPFPILTAHGHRYSLPEDGVALAGDGENAGHWVEFTGAGALRPRLEFDQPLNNPENPLLASLRRMSADDTSDELVGRARVYLTSLSSSRGYAICATPSELDHARRVLTLLTPARQRPETAPTLYSSGAHHHLTADREPWLNTSGQRARRKAVADRYDDMWRPRPEFNRPLTNPANGMVAWVRRRRAAGETYSAILWRVNNGGTSGTTGEYDQARRILGRLAHLPDASSEVDE